MNDEELPILKKSYELYKIYHEYQRTITKQARYTIYARGEQVILDMLECLCAASYAMRAERVTLLHKTSVKLNLLRLLVRLMKDTKTLNTKQYVTLQEAADEIGRMLGGWIRAEKRP